MWDARVTVRAVQWQERRDDRGRGETAHAPRDPVVAKGGTLETGTQLQRQWNGLVVTTGALSVVARAEQLESRSYNTCRRPIQLRSATFPSFRDSFSTVISINYRRDNRIRNRAGF